MESIVQPPPGWTLQVPLFSEIFASVPKVSKFSYMPCRKDYNFDVLLDRDLESFAEHTAKIHYWKFPSTEKFGCSTVRSFPLDRKMEFGDLTIAGAAAMRQYILENDYTAYFYDHQVWISKLPAATYTYTYAEKPKVELDITIEGSPVYGSYVFDVLAECDFPPHPVSQDGHLIDYQASFFPFDGVLEQSCAILVDEICTILGGNTNMINYDPLVTETGDYIAYQVDETLYRQSDSSCWHLDIQLESAINSRCEARVKKRKRYLNGVLRGRVKLKRSPYGCDPGYSWVSKQHERVWDVGKSRRSYFKKYKKIISVWRLCKSREMYYFSKLNSIKSSSIFLVESALLLCGLTSELIESAHLWTDVNFDRIGPFNGRTDIRLDKEFEISDCRILESFGSNPHEKLEAPT